MHCLHAKDLVITLLVIEHGCGKVVKHILVRKRSIGLGRRVNTDGRERSSIVEGHDLYPFVPDKKSVAVVVRRV